MRLGDNSPSGPKTSSAADAPQEMLDLVRRLMPLLLDGDPLGDTGGLDTRPSNVLKEGQLVWDQYVETENDPTRAWGIPPAQLQS